MATKTTKQKAVAPLEKELNESVEKIQSLIINMQGRELQECNQEKKELVHDSVKIAHMWLDNIQRVIAICKERKRF